MRINFIRIPTGFLFELFHFFSSVVFHAGRLIRILICCHSACSWNKVKELTLFYRINKSICYMLKANCRDLPIASGPESSLPGMYWQWNPAVRNKSLSIIGLICQWEASYQPLSFIQWPWWQPVWETKTTKWGSRKEVWEQTLSSVFFRIFYKLSKWSSGSGGSVPPLQAPSGGPCLWKVLIFLPSVNEHQLYLPAL